MVTGIDELGDLSVQAPFVPFPFAVQMLQTRSPDARKSSQLRGLRGVINLNVTANGATRSGLGLAKISTERR